MRVQLWDEDGQGGDVGLGVTVTRSSRKRERARPMTSKPGPMRMRGSAGGCEGVWGCMRTDVRRGTGNS